MTLLQAMSPLLSKHSGELATQRAQFHSLQRDRTRLVLWCGFTAAFTISTALCTLITATATFTGRQRAVNYLVTCC
jgi:hypothetical protein